MDKYKVKKILIGDFTFKRLIRSMMFIVISVYIGLGLCAYFFADKVAFQPPRSTYRDSDETIKVKVADGNTISALYIPNASATYTILFSHGNGEDLGITRSSLEDLRQIGFSVFAYDYEGYGTSTGTPSEGNAYRDAEAAYSYLTDEMNVAPERIILHGRSLGGAVAIDLATRKPVAGLVVESSFVSGFRVLMPVTIFLFDRFRSAAKIKQVRCPVLVMHGRNDEVIGFWHGEQLYKAANYPKMYLWIDNAGHNNFADAAGAKYGEALCEFQAMINKHRTVTR